MTSPASSHHHFVLVHGVGHGAWCWFRLRCLLEAAGHKVTCLDLAGAGLHPSDADTILSFEDYDKPLFDFMSALPEEEKVILVGHSAGGLSVTHAMHEFAEKITVAIFIAATMLPSGFLSEEDKKDGMPDFSAVGDVYDLKFSLGMNHPPTSAVLRKKFQHIIFYQLSPEEVISLNFSEPHVHQFSRGLKTCYQHFYCSEFDPVLFLYSTLASMLLRPVPVLALSRARFGGGGEENVKKARRVYIKTTQDNTVKPEQQDAMIKRWPPSEALVMDADHSPFFSAPGQLFELILQASSSTTSHNGL